jgi:hypothetical protein
MIAKAPAPPRSGTLLKAGTNTLRYPEKATATVAMLEKRLIQKPHPIKKAGKSPKASRV